MEAQGTPESSPPTPRQLLTLQSLAMRIALLMIRREMDGRKDGPMNPWEAVSASGTEARVRGPRGHGLGKGKEQQDSGGWQGGQEELGSSVRPGMLGPLEGSARCEGSLSMCLKPVGRQVGGGLAPRCGAHRFAGVHQPPFLSLLLSRGSPWLGGEGSCHLDIPGSSHRVLGVSSLCGRGGVGTDVGRGGS